MYDRDSPTHLKVELDHLGHHDAAVLTSPPFSLFESLEWYPTCFGTGRFRQMRTDVSEFQMWDLSASVVTRLSINRLDPEIIGEVAVLLVFAVLARTRIPCVYAVEKKWITSAEWSSCWHGCSAGGRARR